MYYGKCTAGLQFSVTDVAVGSSIEYCTVYNVHVCKYQVENAKCLTLVWQIKFGHIYGRRRCHAKRVLLVAYSIPLSSRDFIHKCDVQVHCTNHQWGFTFAVTVTATQKGSCRLRQLCVLHSSLVTWLHSCIWRVLISSCYMLVFVHHSMTQLSQKLQIAVLARWCKNN